MEVFAKSLRFLALAIVIWTLVNARIGLLRLIAGGQELPTWGEAITWLGPVVLLMAAAVMVPAASTWLLGGALVVLLIARWWVGTSDAVLGDVAPTMTSTFAAVLLAGVPVIAVLGLSRPLAAGIMLLVIALVPGQAIDTAVFDAIRTGLGAASVVLIGAALLGGRLQRIGSGLPARQHSPGARQPSESARFASTIDPNGPRTRMW